MVQLIVSITTNIFTRNITYLSNEHSMLVTIQIVISFIEETIKVFMLPA